MAASDLATLADAKAWLSGSSGIGSTDDALIARLITDVSAAISAYLGRPALAPRAYTERFDGNGRTRMFLLHYPVLQLTSLVIDNEAIPAAPLPAAGATRGRVYLLAPWNGLPPGRPQALDLFELAFCKGRQNILVNYNAGYALHSEAAAAPARRRRCWGGGGAPGAPLPPGPRRSPPSPAARPRATIMWRPASTASPRP